MVDRVHAERLSILRDDVCDVDQRGARPVDRVDDARHDESGRDRRIQTARAEDDLVGGLDGGNGTSPSPVHHRG